ncbi:SMP-30/gluconolactonase/LRE family protein [Paenibacillus sp. MWE-103]|uniref:Regucalcin n=1 Tax=Paenibacillus artemisiicola TaxID=1172618 RepID=A0ABS3W5X8_9BACL|nr:SMP-30/gluconolactonase/LRE family protein [Paenibacillus artemisiicola]MBO7743699.1 SMP-30/gluconolactonase/LRE family protein [Paenibacillus artemisiicola]
MTESALELLVDARATLGEGPCWDETNKRLYWVDIIEKKLHCYSPAKQTNETFVFEESPGAVAVRKSGGVVLAMKQGFYAVDQARVTLLAHVDQEPRLNRFNDGKCDRMGRFWAGTMPLEGSDPTGSLYCLDTDLQVRHLFGEVACSNGLAWSPDDTTMYYIDSPTKQVVAFDYDRGSGAITRKRTVVTIPDGEGVPDGMTIDAEGMLWVAQWDGCRVSRWNPRTGNRIDAISLPAARVTSCAFGGDRLDELYITTARSGLDEKALSEQPQAGGLFRVKVGVRGTLSHPFMG